MTSSPEAHHECVATLTAHTSYISSLTLSAKGLYTGSFDGAVLLWRPDASATPQPHTHRNLIAPGGGAVKSLVVLDDKLFTAHQDHRIRVWRIHDDDSDENHASTKKYVHLATLPTLGDRFVKGLMPKNQIQIRRHKKSSWVHHVDAVSGLALSKDATNLYSVSWDRTLKIWRTNDFKCLESITNAHDDAVNALAVANDGDIYTGSADTKIKIWRRRGSTGEKKHSLVAILSNHESGVNALAFNAETSVLYSGSCDGLIQIWERDEDGNVEEGGVLRGHRESILCLAIVADIACSGSADRTVRIWRRSWRQEYWCVGVIEGHDGPVKCLTGETHHTQSEAEAEAEAEDGSLPSSSYLIYSGGLDCNIKVWHVMVPSSYHT